MTSPLIIVGWTLIHFVWQACVIAVPVATILRLTRRRSANLRYLVACAGLAAMLAAPILTARVLWVGSEPVDTPLTSDVGAPPVAVSAIRSTRVETLRGSTSLAPS